MKNDLRIKVRRGQTFIVDLAHGIASDTFTLGPLRLYRGKGALETIIAASESPDFCAFVGSAPESSHAREPGFLNGFVGGCLLRASLVPVCGASYYGPFIDVDGDGGARSRFNSRYWDALLAMSDERLIDEDWHRPAMFLKDGTVVGCIMGLVPPSSWSKDGAS